MQSKLQHTLYEFGNAPKEQWLPMVEPLAAFAAKIHEQNLMHRDFSPGNVLWDVIDGTLEQVWCVISATSYTRKSLRCL